ncbi:MAG: SMP-30/gluconolactonase/LRE family protein [Pseudomonadota bacterium]
MNEVREIATGLKFPEGPIAMDDGSVIVVEIARGTLTRVAPDGEVAVVADLGGGPNGAAIGPDGKCYVCNNGGFEWAEEDGLLIPGATPADYEGGRIERVDLGTGEVEVLYTECDGRPLLGPNDIVFDAGGGFWFSDNGKRRERTMDRGSILYARADGTGIDEVFFPFEHPNGVGLSPDDKTLYFTETVSGRCFAAPLEAPGKPVNAFSSFDPTGCLYGAPGMQLFDSLAVDSAGNICIGTIINGGITVLSPAGELVEHVPLPDPFVTNICFGGPDLGTAYATLSGTGKLVAFDWPRPGLPLHYLNER